MHINQMLLNEVMTSVLASLNIDHKNDEVETCFDSSETVKAETFVPAPVALASPKHRGRSLLPPRPVACRKRRSSLHSPRSQKTSSSQQYSEASIRRPRSQSVDSSMSTALSSPTASSTMSLKGGSKKNGLLSSLRRRSFHRVDTTSSTKEENEIARHVQVTLSSSSSSCPHQDSLVSLSSASSLEAPATEEAVEVTPLPADPPATHLLSPPASMPYSRRHAQAFRGKGNFKEAPLTASPETVVSMDRAATAMTNTTLGTLSSTSSGPMTLDIDEAIASPTSTDPGPVLLNLDLLDVPPAATDKTSEALPATASNDDAESVGSFTSQGGYFDLTDFQPRNWLETLDAPTFGFALIALTICICHPLLFVAGAITAYGTTTAVGAGYQYFSTEKPEKDATATLATDESPTLDENQETSLSDSLIPLSIRTGSDDAVAIPALDSMRIVPPPSNRHEHRPASNLSLDDNWIRQHYPPLANQLVKDVALRGLNAIQFFRVFFDHDAPYSFKEFQKKRGDSDIVYQQWSDSQIPRQGNNTVISLHPHAPALAAAQGSSEAPLSDFYLHHDRTITFKAKTNSLLGPPLAHTTKHQRILIVSKRLAILESHTMLSEIPFSDRFSIMVRWIIRSSKDTDTPPSGQETSSPRYTSYVSVSSEVIFSKSCPFESQIRSKSTSTIMDIITAWCSMAVEALKRTEEHKRHRLLLQEDDDEDWESQQPSETNGDDDDNAGRKMSGDSEGIEVRHSAQCRRKALVVGEQASNSSTLHSDTYTLSDSFDSDDEDDSKKVPRTISSRRPWDLGRSISRVFGGERLPQEQTR
jgi:VAD1 Analog of StAR-related lipid transfer domain